MTHNPEIECAHQDGVAFYFHRSGRASETPGDEFRQFGRAEAWKPAMNIYRDAENVYVILDLSGVDSDGVGIQCCETVLQISGQRNAPPPPTTCGPVTVLQMEIDHGPFRVRVEFDFALDSAAIQADYDRGLLQLTIPYTKEG